MGPVMRVRSDWRRSGTQNHATPLGTLSDLNSLDILSALNREDSPKETFRLRVSSGLEYAFGWAVNERHRVVTNGACSSAYSPVDGTFLPAICGHRRRLVIQPARWYGSRQPNCHAVHGSSSRCIIFAEAFRSAWRHLSYSEYRKWSPSQLPIEPHTEHCRLVWYTSTFSTRIPARSALYVMSCWS